MFLFPEYICEGKTGNLSCPSRNSIIILHAPLYGREDKVTCKHEQMRNFNCRTKDNIVIVEVINKCQNQESCTLKPSNSLFGGDPCQNTYKYLKVVYECKGTYVIYII